MSKVHNVIVRYGNFFQGDDDFFTHCLILDNGECWLLGQGLREVTLRVFKALDETFEKLAAALTTPIPAGWATASYTGYNFITDAESSTATEIAVFGLKVNDPPKPGNYYVPPSGSDVEKLVKEIARIDQGL
ncbi:MAG TPA: hypothetical protein VF043_06455 [Ktedonobacteraceae bacterium]